MDKKTIDICYMLMNFIKPLVTQMKKINTQSKQKH